MKTFKPRPYQLAAIQSARDSLSKNRATIMKLFTGAGKTIIATKIIESVERKGGRALFLAHTDELVLQFQEKLQKSTGMETHIEKAKLTAHDKEGACVCASVQSLSKPRRLAKYPHDHFNLIITDEVHRGASDTYQAIYNHFPGAKMIGLTATPFRTDEKSLGESFDDVCCDYGLEWGIANGWLVPIESTTVPLDIDLSSGDLADVIIPIMEKVADSMIEHGCKHEKVLIFLPTKAASKRFVEILDEKGFNVQHLDGDTKDRQNVLKNFHEAEAAVLCNPMVLSVGYDEPTITTIIDLTPTKSTLLYIQKVGRGTRPISGRFPEDSTAGERRAIIAASVKPNMKILDFLWHGATHNLCHPARLFAKTPEVEEKMVEISSKGGSANLQEVEKEAKKMLVSEREQALAENLKAFKGNKSQKFDPVLQAVSLFDDSLLDWKPEVKWQAEPLTEAQESFLEKNGFDCSGFKKGYASKLMDSLANRREKGLATPNMVRCLMKNGYDNAYNMSFDDARTAMDRLSKIWAKSKKWKGRKR